MAVKERARAVESPRPAPRPTRVLAPERQPAVPAGPLRAPGAVSAAPLAEQEKGIVPPAAAPLMPGLSEASAPPPARRDLRPAATALAQAPAQGNARLARRIRTGDQGPTADHGLSQPGQAAAAAPAAERPLTPALLGSPAPTADLSARATGTAAPQPAPKRDGSLAIGSLKGDHGS